MIRLAAELARNVTAFATSSGVPMRPIAQFFTAPSYIGFIVFSIISHEPPLK